jgi:predicted metalloprotease with PDZ domain
MKSKRWLVAFAAVIFLVGFAGLAYPGEKCTASTQECLDYMVKTYKKRGWVGLELDKDKKGGTRSLFVTRVVPGSPAEAAGFRIGDRLVALNGIELTEANEKALSAIYKKMVPGKQVTYRVERKGGMRELTVTLATLPDDVLAQWVGRHMLDHAQVDIAKN